jgi:hypothetical protein
MRGQFSAIEFGVRFTTIASSGAHHSRDAHAGRKLLTTGQIVQFVLDLVTCIPFIVLRLSGVPCNGSLRSWILPTFVGTVLFVAFNRLFERLYRQQPAARGKAKQGKSE